MKRAMVFIDGSNFYHRLKLLLGKDAALFLSDFNYQEFCAWLCCDFVVADIRYYIGTVSRQNNNIKSEKMYNDQQRFFRKLQAQGMAIITGQLIQHPDRSYHEKGVDVRLAVEMIRFARQNQYDQAFLISSDTDLVAAVEEVKSFGKSVQYVGIAHGQSFGLSKVCSDVRLLRPEDVKSFLPPALIMSE
ncbi:MAG: NYN domain-containing protein [Candidatus Magasanikbacteria bacterium]|nr:NYN domain-containing protein [Candidatus Magasanikbacteria bacterium]